VALGATDRSGFAALGMGELLVHTFDLASGLGSDWRPPAPLAGLVVDRLLSGAARDDDAPDDGAALLLWATGRIELDGRPPAGDWVWRAALRGT
jgi:hypothetical protein